MLKVSGCLLLIHLPIWCKRHINQKECVVDRPKLGKWHVVCECIINENTDRSLDSLWQRMNEVTRATKHQVKSSSLLSFFFFAYCLPCFHFLQFPSNGMFEAQEMSIVPGVPYRHNIDVIFHQPISSLFNKHLILRITQRLSSKNIIYHACSVHYLRVASPHP